MKLSKRLLKYSLASTAFLGLANEANADVVYTDVNPDSTLENSFYFIDFDGDGTHEFTAFNFYYTNVYTTYAYARLSLGQGLLVPASSQFGIMGRTAIIGGSNAVLLDALPLGYTIGNSRTFESLLGYFGNKRKQIYSSTTIFDTSAGYWDDVSDKYVGVRFHIGTATHYGWIRCDVGADYRSVTIKGFAYDDTPDAPIVTGVTTAIDSPLESSPIQVYSNQANLIILQEGVASVEIAVHDLLGRLLEVQTITGAGTISSDKWSTGDILIVTSRWGLREFSKKVIVQ